jgi:hypothetical protein
MLSLIVVMAAASAIVLLGAELAAAQTSDRPQDNDQIVLHGTLLVPAGETVDSAVIFDGPATIDGTVNDSLVVFNGDVEITGTIGKDVMVFNGDVTLRSGATVGGDLVSQGTVDIEPGATVTGSQRDVATEVDLGQIGLASRIAWWIGYSVSALILGLVLLLLLPSLDAALIRIRRDRIGASFGFGAILFFAFPIAAGLLLVTVVGIPLGLFFLLALALIYTVGYVVGAHLLGRFILKEPTSRYVAFLVGLVIARAVALVPVLGGIAWFALTIAGLGALLLAARTVRPSEAQPPSLAAPAPPPMPASS